MIVVRYSPTNKELPTNTDDAFWPAPPDESELLSLLMDFILV